MGEAEGVGLEEDKEGQKFICEKGKVVSALTSLHFFQTSTTESVLKHCGSIVVVLLYSFYWIKRKPGNCNR
jgi:hypothetical protein